jgi:DNA-binding NtrC family response regulator
MKDTINLLLVDDSPDDSELLTMELANNGLVFNWRREDTGKGLRSAFSEKTWDVVLCDIRMPNLVPAREA